MEDDAVAAAQRIDLDVFGLRGKAGIELDDVRSRGSLDGIRLLY